MPIGNLDLSRLLRRLPCYLLVSQPAAQPRPTHKTPGLRKRLPGGPQGLACRGRNSGNSSLGKISRRSPGLRA